MTLGPISCTTPSDPLTKVPVKTFPYHLNCNMVEHHLVSKLSLYSQTKDDFVAQVTLHLVTGTSWVISYKATEKVWTHSPTTLYPAHTFTHGTFSSCWSTSCRFTSSVSNLVTVVDDMISKYGINSCMDYQTQQISYEHISFGSEQHWFGNRYYVFITCSSFGSPTSW